MLHLLKDIQPADRSAPSACHPRCDRDDRSEQLEIHVLASVLWRCQQILQIYKRYRNIQAVEVKLADDLCKSDLTTHSPIWPTCCRKRLHVHCSVNLKIHCMQSVSNFVVSGFRVSCILCRTSLALVYWVLPGVFQNLFQGCLPKVDPTHICHANQIQQNI